MAQLHKMSMMDQVATNADKLEAGPTKNLVIKSLLVLCSLLKRNAAMLVCCRSFEPKSVWRLKYGFLRFRHPIENTSGP